MQRYFDPTKVYHLRERQGHPWMVAWSMVFFVLGVSIASWTLLYGGSASAAPDPLIPEGTYVKGQPDAPVTLVAFTDFRCEACRAFGQEVYPRIAEDFIDKGVVRFAYRHLPASGRGSQRAALASECAGAQGKFWRFFPVLSGWQMSGNGGYLSDDLLRSLTIGMGIDYEIFRTCMTDDAVAAIVDRDVDDAASLGVTSAPAVFVNGVLVDRPTDYVQLKLHIVAASAER